MPAPAAPTLSIEGIKKNFNGREVLRGVDFTVPRGSIFTVLGPSGAGKSVLLKCIADIVTPDAGRISFEGRPLADHSVRVDFRRRCGFLFQGNALFDSLTCIQNVALPLEQTTTLHKTEIHRRAHEALRQLEMDDFADHYPGQLSGGMQKRLALARAIVAQPEIVLFDEPTAGLDPLRRNAVFSMIAKYQRRFGFTALVVTHDVPEALAASDCVALLNQGRICFEGTPAEFESSTEQVVAMFRDSVQALGESLSAIRNEPAAA
jgi:phospholipid/cholesterol/gamma-HCH transport system ATP-binding protein